MVYKGRLSKMVRASGVVRIWEHFPDYLETQEPKLPEILTEFIRVDETVEAIALTDKDVEIYSSGPYMNDSWLHSPLRRLRISRDTLELAEEKQWVAPTKKRGICSSWTYWKEMRRFRENHFKFRDEALQKHHDWSALAVQQLADKVIEYASSLATLQLEFNVPLDVLDERIGPMALNALGATTTLAGGNAIAEVRREESWGKQQYGFWGNEQYSCLPLRIHYEQMGEEHRRTLAREERLARQALGLTYSGPDPATIITLGESKGE